MEKIYHSQESYLRYLKESNNSSRKPIMLCHFAIKILKICKEIDKSEMKIENFFQLIFYHITERINFNLIVRAYLGLS